MTHRRAALLSFFGGAASFWIPDVIVFNLCKSQYGFVWMTGLCPIAGLGFYAWILRRRARGIPSGPSSALLELLGIWVLAPWFMVLASKLQPGPHDTWPAAMYGFVLLVMVFPPYTFFFSTANGSGYALILITLVLPFLHCRKELGQWIVPPRFAFWRKGRSRGLLP